VECRWILKTDYLSASSQEGKFLAEEPYEWHKSGLSEDGAINMEAPRKWRLVKEKTGHGAFYGMRIVVYGDCIAPPLVCFVLIFVRFMLFYYLPMLPLFSSELE